MKEKHIAINRDMFQGECVLKKIKEETGTNQIDIIFGVYAVLEYRKNMLGIAGTTLRDIENFIYSIKHSSNIKKVRSAIHTLKEYNVIDYDYDINDVKANVMIEVCIIDYERYMAISKEDFTMLKKMDSNFFLLFNLINNYHNDVMGYSFPNYDLMSGLLSSRTISKHLDSAYLLGIYKIEVKGRGWKYNDMIGKALRSNNMYTKVDSAVDKVARMTKEEIQTEVDAGITKSEEGNRYKADAEEGNAIRIKPRKIGLSKENVIELKTTRAVQ